MLPIPEHINYNICAMLFLRVKETRTSGEKPLFHESKETPHLYIHVGIVIVDGAKKAAASSSDEIERTA
jgi:hypothetical protein